MKNKILLGFVVLMMWGAGCRLKELDDVVPVDCPQANFSVSTQFCVPPCTIKCTDLSANAVKREWYFDRDSISRDTHPSISFQSDGVHSIRLIAYGADGCTDDTTIYVLLSPSAGSAPLANFTVLNDSLWAGCPIQFQNTSLNYTTVQWWFGDGEYSAENTPAHTYSGAGNFPVTLRVVQNGVIDDTTIVIQVNTPPVFSRPYSLPTPFLKVGGACQLSDGSFAVYVTGGGNSDVTLNPDAYFVRVSSSSYDATTVLVEENGIVAGMLPTVDGNVMTLTELTSGDSVVIQKRRPDGSVEHLPTFFSGLTFDGNTNVFVKTTDLTYAFIARTGNHLRLVKTGSLGEEEWRRDISNVVSFDSTETSYCLSVANDGGLLVASSIYGNIWLTKYNNSGTEIFKRLVSTGGQDFFYPTNLIPLSDGNIYMSLSQINDPYYTKIYKISTGGALLLERSVLAHFEKAVEEEGRVVFYGQTRTSVFNQIPIILSYYQTFATDLSLAQPAGAYLSPGSVFDISNQFLAARIITNDCRPTYIWQGSDPYYYSNLGYFNRFVVEK